MSARKQYGGGLAVFAGLAVALSMLSLPGCGGGGGCAGNPTGPGCVASPTPTPTPLVTRIVSQGNDSLESGFLGWVVFTTTTAGTLGVEVNWTFPTNDVDIFLARGSDPCTDETFDNRTCSSRRHRGKHLDEAREALRTQHGRRHRTRSTSPTSATPTNPWPGRRP